ncbi:MAG: ABC-2 transporter permease [Ruminococcaceae bacterium]|jgi:predicted permease|nr:ABC-2 transporter permease [Oscillospiraceae bacterium]
MKALLIKDLSYLKSSRILVIVPVVGLILSLSGGSFFITWVCIMAASMVQTTFTYDEFENGMSYLLTLPVSRRQYVRSKYLMALLCVAAMICAALALTFVLDAVMGRAQEDLLTSAVTGLIVADLYISVSIPGIIRLGVERGRWVVLGVSAVAAALIVGAAVVAEIGSALESALARSPWLAVIPLLFLLVLPVLSYRLSMRFIDKKEY